MGETIGNVERPAIAPSILTADFTRLGDAIRAAERGGANAIHLDVMDGHFVPNISFGPLVVEAIRKITSLPLDVHLMIDEPDKYVDEFADAGAGVLTVHAEATPHLHRVIQRIHNRGVAAGVSINPATPVSALEEIVGDVELVLIMSVNPGFGGQRFIPRSIEKLRQARRLLDQRGRPGAALEVDGGVKAENIRELAEAGADMFVTGSAVFNEKQSVADALATLRAALNDS